MKGRFWLPAALLLATTPTASCSDDVVVGTTFAAPSAIDGGTDTGAVQGCRVAACVGRVYACGDCEDNDADGLVDMEDPDCYGPCHNAEDTFFGSIPGQNAAQCKQDCYFDQDTGSGNDGCNWSHTCDPLEVAPAFAPGGAACEFDPSASVPGTTESCAALQTSQSTECLDTCLTLVPNGCDCFGCCSVPGAPTPIFLGSTEGPQNQPTCDLKSVADPTRCRPCTPVAGCFNDCQRCELCIGKSALPADCSATSVDAGGCAIPECAPGSTPCGADCLENCPNGSVCLTGCCQRLPT